ncbi:hypothetical protein D3C81_1639810 [compost metagenome]
MNDHPSRLVYYNDVYIFIIHIQRNILWFNFNSFRFRYDQCNTITFSKLIVSLDGISINCNVFTFDPKLNLTTRNVFTELGLHIFINTVLLRRSIDNPFKGSLF